MTSDEFVVICRWCQMIKSIAGIWENVAIPEEIRIMYGICPDCDKKTDEEEEK